MILLIKKFKKKCRLSNDKKTTDKKLMTKCTEVFCHQCILLPVHFAFDLSTLKKKLKHQNPDSFHFL